MAVTGRILVVDDERSMGELLEIMLRREGHEVTVAPGGEAALAALEAGSYDVVVTDLKMPRVDGLKVLAAVREGHPDTEVIIVTAFATADTAISAMKQGAYDYLKKPFKVEEMLVTVERALEKRALVRANLSLREQLHGRFRLRDMVGRSPAMQQVFDRVRRVARTRSSVLIMGESGTGKELVARAIHDLSDRSGGPFVPVNCGAIPDTLMESELFGHVRGAFTGATAAREGLFALASGGTLFLDEIAEIAPSMQVKLLRALQERRVKPVGGSAEQPVDVRIVAATNRNLDQEVAAGRFRSDLFYRLNVVPIALPPLRARREDIRPLAEHFLRKFAAEAGEPERTLSPRAMHLLCNYHFPGNVRELENMMERAVALAPGREIPPEILPELETPAPGTPPERLPERGISLDRHMARIEQSLLLQALERTGGNRTEAARVLGISLRSLRYRLAKYGVGGGEAGEGAAEQPPGEAGAG